jgi:hypothetical protein
MGTAPGKMRFLLHFSFLIFLLVIVSASFSWSAHNVGEPALEEHPIWRQCCDDHDCVPQQVKVTNNKENGNVSVKIEGVEAAVNKEKFHRVPSARTWVCYFDRNGEIANKNIRCILYSEKSGAVRIRVPLTTRQSGV